MTLMFQNFLFAKLYYVWKFYEKGVASTSYWELFFLFLFLFLCLACCFLYFCAEVAPYLLFAYHKIAPPPPTKQKKNKIFADMEWFAVGSVST